MKLHFSLNKIKINFASKKYINFNKVNRSNKSVKKLHIFAYL